MSALNALCDFNFAFAGKKWNGAHFAQVHANGIICFFECTRRQVELDLFAFFSLEFAFEALVQCRRRQLGPLEKINTLGANGG